MDDSYSSYSSSFYSKVARIISCRLLGFIIYNSLKIVNWINVVRRLENFEDCTNYGSYDYVHLSLKFSTRQLQNVFKILVQKFQKEVKM